MTRSLRLTRLLRRDALDMPTFRSTRMKTMSRTLARPTVIATIVAMVAASVFLLTRDGPAGSADSAGEDRSDDRSSTVSVDTGSSIAREAPTAAGAAGVDLPDGGEVVNGYPTRFPHSDLGPVAAQAALARAQIGFDYNQAIDLTDIYGDPDPNVRARLATRARLAVKLRREQAGIPATGTIPAPASYALTPIAFTLKELGTDYYAVNLLSYVSVTNGNGATRDSLYAGTQLFKWIDEDWKVVEGSPSEINALARQGQPKPAVPGTPEFVRAGWILIQGEPR